MKKFILVIIMTYSSFILAFKEKDLNINAGFGVFGSRGLLGISGEKFISENDAISLAFGLDFIGATTAIGYKYFTGKLNNTQAGSVWGKCFFIFECDSHIYVGPSVQYASNTSIKITENTNIREYKIDPKWLGLLSLGFRSVLKNNISIDSEISYRSIVSGGTTTQTSGIINDDRQSIEMGFRTVGINFGIGYLF